MAVNVVQYGSLVLTSAEVTDFSYDRTFNIISQSTIVSLELTQPGNLSPIEIKVNAIVRDNASTKFTQWHNLLATKPLELLTLWQRVWGNYYLKNMSVSSEELDKFGDIIRMRMSLVFISNQNFE